MNVQDYYEKRLEEQREWYSKKASENQKKFRFWQTLKIVAALLVPVVTLFMDDWMGIKYVVGALGAVIAFVDSYMKIYDFKELWMKYRSTAEMLKREWIYFETKSGPYQKDNSLQQLVARCERIMKEENKEWFEIAGKEAS